MWLSQNPIALLFDKYQGNCALFSRIQVNLIHVWVTDVGETNVNGSPGGSY